VGRRILLGIMISRLHHHLLLLLLLLLLPSSLKWEGSLEGRQWHKRRRRNPHHCRRPAFQQQFVMVTELAVTAMG
jgi:hypothetical protein